jgi:hypothetical protein
MALCPTDDVSFSDSDLGATYSAKDVLPLIPAKGYTGENRTGDAYNLLTSDALAAIIDKFQGTKIPTMPPFSLSGPVTEDKAFKQYITSNEILKNEVLDEYCFYNSRYRYAIKTLISQIADATAGVTANVDRINKLTEAAISLNQKLTDITQIVNAITIDQYKAAQNMDATINDLNTQIDSYYQRLKVQADILKSEAPAAELKKRMVEFTREKSLVSNNMLSFYFFMDVVALGILFYVYRAS